MYNDMTKLITLPSGDIVYKSDNAIIQQFKVTRYTLSTSAYNGGFSDELKYVFNYDEITHNDEMCEMRADTYEKHLKIIAKEIGIGDVDKCTGLSTAAQMKNVSIKSLSYDNIDVTAIVTGGIDVNGGRAGDPASWTENDDGSITIGTVNILLNINASLSKGAMAVALMTCTEAKAVAIQELQAPSKYSTGIATGSGTDGVIVIVNHDDHTMLTDAGKHSKLGELIGKTVISAVKEALFLQTGICPQRQYSVQSRLERFGFSYEKMYQKRGKSIDIMPEEFNEKIQKICSSDDIIIKSIQLSHLLDEFTWGLMGGEKANVAVANLLNAHLTKLDQMTQHTQCFIKQFEQCLWDIIQLND